MNNNIYTIGHSNHPIDEFIRLLKEHTISTVVDVRSCPYSQYNTHFNKNDLHASLHKANIHYVYMGDKLGGRPNAALCHDENKVNFDKLAKTKEFQHGIQWLVKHIPNERIVLMCAEKEPLCCHRTILVSRQLTSYKFNIMHILEDGTLEDHKKTELRLVRMLKIEPTLFEPDLTQKELIERAYKKQEENISYEAKEAHKTNV